MRFIAVLTLLLPAVPGALAGQRDSVLAHRWVGIHQGRPLQFEFYTDTMLVVDDAHPLEYRLTGDSLVAFGDTIVVAEWRYVLGYLLLSTPDGPVTMSPQGLLARPLTGRWRGQLGTEEDEEIEVYVFSGGQVRWRPLAGGEWVQGEWERESRFITFIWPDETEWRAQYDPFGNNLLFEATLEGSSGTILTRAFR